MKRFTTADADVQVVTANSSDIKALQQGAVDEKRRAFLRDWLASRGRSISLLSAGGLIFLPLLGASGAQAQSGPVLVSTIDGVSNLAFNPDGSLQISLSNGQVVTIAAAEVTVMANGAVAISAAAAELVVSLAGIGAAAVGTGTLAALAGGAAAAAAAAAGGGGSDAAPSPSSPPPPPPVGGGGVDGAFNPLALNAGMVLVAQNFTGFAPADAVVRITINDANGDPINDPVTGEAFFQGIADGDGDYSIVIPFDALALPDGEYQIVVQAFNDDGAGNPTGNPRGTQTVTITVDTVPPTLDSIETPIAVNDQINIADSQTDLVITGTSTSAEDGAQVVVTINGVAHEGVVTGGTWSVTVPAAALQALPDGNIAFDVEVFDLAGNSDTGSVTVDVDLTPPVVGVDALPFGAFLNAADAGADQTITGTAAGADGQVVTVTLTDSAGTVLTFTPTAGAAPAAAWTLTATAAQLGALAEGEVTVSA